MSQLRLPFASDSNETEMAQKELFAEVALDSSCESQELPACFNPILTGRCGVIGMACMGTGFEAEEGESTVSQDLAAS